MYEVIIKKTSLQTVPESQAFNKISDTGGDDNGPNYGYVIKPAHEKEVTTTIFTQTVEEINILDIVEAVNSVALGRKGL